MQIIKNSVAGTMESSDIMINMEPGKNGIEIDLQSVVEKLYGQRIRTVIEETLAELGIKAAKVTAIDKGSLDCTIRARVKAAVFRASSASDPDNASKGKV